MADLQETEVDPNPFLSALKQYKSNKTVPAPTVQESGPINPFSDLVKKKDQNLPVSSNGSSLLENGSGNSQNSQTPNTSGFTKVDPNSVKQATTTTPKFSIDNSATSPTVVQQQAGIDAQKKLDAQNPGSWSNTLPQFTHAVTQMVTKGGAGLANMTRDLISTASSNPTNADKPLYKQTPVYDEHGSLVDTKQELTDYGKQVDAGKQSDVLGKLVLGLDAYNKETDKADAQNHLPNTFLGNTASGLIHIAPDIAATALFPEEEAMEGGSFLSKLKGAATNPFTKLQATKGVLSGYDEAKQKGENPIVGAAKSGAAEGAQGAGMIMLGNIAGDYVAPKIIDGLDAVGLVKNGKYTKMGADALADATVFGAYPIASNLVQGKPIDWNEVESGVGTGLGFGALKGRKTYADHTDVENQVKEVLKDRQGIALQNFMNASPEAIVEAYHLPDNSGELNAKAVDNAHKAIKETDLHTKTQYAAASSTLAKASDVKGTVEAILNDPTGFIKSIQGSDMPDEQKTAIINKINDTHKQLDPIEQQKTAMGRKIQDLDADIAKAQPIADNSPDPVAKTEAEVGIENLQKKKDELFKALKKTISEQHEAMQKSAPDIVIVPHSIGDDNIVGAEPSISIPKPINNEQAEPNTEVPAQPQADETGQAPIPNKAVNATDGDTKIEPVTKIREKVRIPHPEFKDIRETAKENNGETTPETLAKEANSKTWYHGSARDLSKETIDSAGYSRPDGLLGLGFYMTDNPEIAETYANLRRNKSGSTVNEFNVKTSKLLDAEKPIDNKVADLYKRTFQSLFYDKSESDEFFDDVKKENPHASLMDYHKAIRNHIADEQIPTSEVHEHFQDLEIGLKDELGYDAISHIGGIQTKGKNHNVMIVLDPSGEYSERRNTFSKKGLYEPKYQDAPLTESELRQKAIDAITHGIIGDGERKPGDTSPRFDLGLDTKEQKRAIRDITNGNYETAAAKKMLSKVMEFEAKGEYPIIEGLGGKSDRSKFATSEQIQEHIDAAKSYKLAKEQDIAKNNKQLHGTDLTHEDFENYYKHRAELEQSGDGRAVGVPTEDAQRPADDQTTGSAQNSGGKTAQGGDEKVNDTTNPTTGGDNNPAAVEGTASEVQPNAGIEAKGEEAQSKKELTEVSSIKQSENESSSPKSAEKANQKESSPKGENDLATEKEVINSGTDNTVPEITKDAKSDKKIKIDKYELIQPSKLKGSEFNLVLGEHPDGKYSIVDKNSGISISKAYESKWEAVNTYEKNREKLTPDVIRGAIEKLNAEKSGKVIDVPDESPKKPLVKLSEKGKASIDKDIEPNGITYDQIKDYEQSRSKPNAGLPATDSKEPGRISEDVRPSDEQIGGKDKNNESSGVREQPEKSAGELKAETLKSNLEEAKKKLSKELKKARGNLNSGVNPELLKSFFEVIDAYSKEKLYKFSEIIKDWINTYGKENFTDEDADAFKSAYAAHVANLDTKERKLYNTQKEVDDFMKSDMKTMRGLEPAASLPTRELPEKERLPVVKDKKGEKDAKETYSWLGEKKGNLVRNLEQLKQFSKDIANFEPFRQVRKFATSKSQASVILKTATSKIIGLVGKDGYQVLRDALVESRLRGARQRWNNFAADVESKTDSQIKNLFEDGKTGQMYDMLDNIKGIGDENPAKFATSLITAGRYADARKYLSDVFKSTADNVLTLGKLSNGKTFDEQVSDGAFNNPKMQEALQAYKEFIEKPIAESHASNEGIFSDALGDLDTYYPMTHTDEEEKQFSAAGKPYKQPLNPNNRFFKGQGNDYSREIADLSDELARSIKVNNKANAIDALMKAGLITELPHNAPDDGTIVLNGERFKAVKVKVGEGRTIIQDGNIINTPSKYVSMPVWLERELKPIFDANSEYDKYSAMGGALNTLVKYQLGGPIEATAHSMRLLGGITNSMPFMQEWAYNNGLLGKMGGIVANTPLAKTFIGMGKILFTDLKSDKALQTIQEMAKNGDIPEKTWTKTWSREFAELTGAKASRITALNGKVDLPNLFDFSPVLYGKRSLDLKARVAMYNLTKAMNPEATPEQHTKMQQQLGVYTKSLQSNLERFVKHHGIAPFYSFGSAIYREGIKAVVGSSSLPLERPTLKEALTTKLGAAKMAKISGYKAAQLLSTGIVGTLAYWMTIYHAQTGKWPQDDPKSKLLRLPFPDYAKNDFTSTYFQNKQTGEWDDFDFSAYANPYLNRGLRAFGAPKAYETNQLGGNASQVENAGFLQAANTAISPFTSSPVVQLATNQAFGSAPYVVSNQDDKGKPGVGMYRKVRTMPSFIQQQAANAAVGFQSLNPVADFLGSEATNALGIKSLKSHADEGDASTMSAFKFALGIAFPRLFIPHGNDDTKSFFLDKEQKSQEKQADKEAQ